MENRLAYEKKLALKQGLLVGGVLGFAVWLLDYRHLLTGAAPYSPVSDFIRELIPSIPAICQQLGVEGFVAVCVRLFPLFVLVFAGMTLGGLYKYIVFRLMLAVHGKRRG